MTDIKFKGFGYVRWVVVSPKPFYSTFELRSGYGRIFWGSSNKVLDLSWWGSDKDGTKVGCVLLETPSASTAY